MNTDAEGRLTLADALVYAEGLGGVDAIVDTVRPYEIKIQNTKSTSLVVYEAPRQSQSVPRP